MASTQLIMVASAPTDTHKAIEKLRTKVKKSTDSLMTTCYITPGAFQDGHGNEWYSKWKGQVNGALTTILQVAHGDGAIELRLVVLQGGPACTQEVEWIRSNLSSLAAEYASRGVCFKTPMLLEDVIHLEYLCNNPTQDGDVCAMPKRRNRPSPVSSPHHHHHRAGHSAADHRHQPARGHRHQSGGHHHQPAGHHIVHVTPATRRSTKCIIS